VNSLAQVPWERLGHKHAVGVAGIRTAIVRHGL
jgi:hypothetical protein